MKNTGVNKVLLFLKKNLKHNRWQKIFVILTGFAATLWFLIRVIPKPDRASYPCQRAAFPLASVFVLWVLSLFALKPAVNKIAAVFKRSLWISTSLIFFIFSGYLLWTIAIFNSKSMADVVDPEAYYKFVSQPSNNPIGEAKGIFPGRVIWSHNPKATKWQGNWKQDSDQWWLDKNTDQKLIEEMLVKTITQLTGEKDLKNAWKKIFEYHNKNSRGLDNVGYKPGESIAIKINITNTYGPNKTNNYSEVSPQVVLALIRQLVNKGGVEQKDIIIYDSKDYAFPFMLTKVWNEFKDVRFVQSNKPDTIQPKNAGYGNHQGLEGTIWIKGITYSKGTYKQAYNMPKQIYDATYLINLAVLKAHSYPYNTMEDGDEGHTGISLCGKNHFGSIQGPSELHKTINPSMDAIPNAYSPLVDLAASPNLGAKTILYLIDGLYAGRKWRTYPLHFPNAPFNNTMAPYENATWPASVLASLDGVAIDCVGLDILNSQAKNNIDEFGHPRILLKSISGDYLMEMAKADNPPSGTKYVQNDKPVQSLGVFEHWDSDATRQYSRNLNPKTGKGIQLIYLPF
jgi:uncharacterized protein (DUF362 family)